MSEKPLEGRDLVQVTVMALYIPIILFANIVVLTGIYLFKQLRTSENYIIVNIAIADLITGTITLPIYIISKTPSTMHLIRSKFSTCYFSTAIKSLSTQTSLTFLTLLCVDRFIAVNWAIRYKKIMTTTNVIIAALFIWIFQITQCSGIALHMDFDETVENLKKRCSFYTNTPLWYRTWYMTFQIDFCLLVCFAMCLEKGIRISKMMERSRLGLNDDYSDSEQRKFFRNARVGARISTLLTLSFVILWLPSILNTPLQHISNMSEDQLETYRTVSRLMRLGVAVLDAPIFAFGKEIHRRAYMRVIKTPPWRWPELRYTMIERMKSSTQRGPSGRGSRAISATDVYPMHRFSVAKIDESPPVVLKIGQDQEDSSNDRKDNASKNRKLKF